MLPTPTPPAGPPPAEAHLVARLRAGQEAAMTDFYDQYGPLLYHRIQGIVQSPAAAEHVLQEGLVHIWQTIGSFEASQQRLYPWALGICRQLALGRRPAPAAATPAPGDLHVG